MEICCSCKSNDGTKRISPGKQIYSGVYWVVEHAFPTRLLGWVVVVLNRHTEQLHDLSLEEWKELGEINYFLTGALHKLLETEKEYLCCLAESEGFKHIHFHMIPKSKVFNRSFSGSKSFQYLKVTEEESIAKDEVREFCDLLSKELATNWSTD